MPGRIAPTLAGLACAALLCAQTADRSQLTAGELREALHSLSVAAPDVRWDNRSVVVGDIAFRAADGKPDIVKFGIDPRRQGAICKGAAKLSLETLDYEPNFDVKGFRQSKTCIVVSDDACDPISLFWNRATHHLNWWRN